MSVELVTAFGAAIVAIIASIGALWLKLRTLNHNVNSRLDLLLEVVKNKAFAAGAAAERERATGERGPVSHPAEAETKTGKDV